MVRVVFVALLVLFTASSAIAATIHNDDSCDIGVAPAATLLLPLFEVDLSSPAGRTTLFSVTNVTAQPQIARVTLWTDWAYPVLSFNLFLTGYDVQSINLRDVLGSGMISRTTAAHGAMSSSANPNHLATAATNCSKAKMPFEIPAATLTEIQSAFTIGATAGCAISRIGGTHPWAIGYATIDVVADCTARNPSDPEYPEQELLFDNVLVGDSQIVDPGQNFAQGETMVHIRAIPEGGAAGSNPVTNLPSTFYDRLSHGRDRRQPLPSVFAARYVQSGGGGFATEFQIWRDGLTGPSAACTDYVRNRAIDLADLVRFDMRENPTSSAAFAIGFPVAPTTNAASSLPSTHAMFPPLTSGDVGGWMYLNLASYYDTSGRARQGWIVISMAAEGRYANQFNAVPLGNGCSPRASAPSTGGRGPNPVGPRP